METWQENIFIDIISQRDAIPEEEEDLVTMSLFSKIHYSFRTASGSKSRIFWNPIRVY
jgi:hypothetical protein